MIVVPFWGQFIIRGEFINIMETKNYYDILGVSVKASLDEITAAKNTLAKKYHPDANMKNGIDTTGQMQEILEAYSVLSDTTKRAEYDRSISGRKPVLQTYDLKNEAPQDTEDSGFVVYWKASGKLYDIIAESDELIRQKHAESRLAQLAMQALPYIILLREAQIPERYWLPDIMNWLLFTWFKNRNYTVAYLLSLYDEHTKKDMTMSAGLKLKSRSRKYEHSVKRLMKY